MTDLLNANSCFTRHSTTQPDQWLYLLGDGGVIYSENKNRFAGLDARGISAYLAFEAGASFEELKRASGDNPDGGLNAIHALAQGIFPAEEEAEHWPSPESIEFADQLGPPVTSRRETVEIAGLAVSIDYPAGTLEAICRDYFRNCPATTRSPRCRLSAERDGNDWVIRVNGHEFLWLKGEDQLGLGLMHASRALLYAESDYDLAFHAAAVADPDGAILLCGPRESGKSTLAAYLTAGGFHLLTDEPALLHLDSSAVSDLCLPISLKEGSWTALRDELPQFWCGPVHVRSDGTRIRLAHARGGNHSPRTWPLVQIVFPEYSQSDEVGAERLSPLQTLFLLNESGLLPARNLGRKRFEQFLGLLGRATAHRIRYRSLDEAWQVLRSLASAMP
jgi:hypothetical protein